MVQANQPYKSQALQRSHDKITTQFASSDTMGAEESHLDALSRTCSKMPGRHERAVVEQTVDVLFEIAASKMSSDADKEVLANLRKHVAQVNEDLMRPKPRYMDAFFFPNLDNVQKLERYIKMAKKSLLICVFNFTNDVLANAVKHVHNQGVSVRIITDDECMTNRGNDCQSLADAGIAVRTDSATEYHMHNKFMVVDGVFLLTGSFNWTFQAGKSNQENLLVVDHPFYLERYTTEFEKLWQEFAPNEVAQQERAARTIQKSYRNKQARKANTGGQNKTQSGKHSSAAGYKFTGW